MHTPIQPPLCFPLSARDFLSAPFWPSPSSALSVRKWQVATGEAVTLFPLHSVLVALFLLCTRRDATRPLCLSITACKLQLATLVPAGEVVKHLFLFLRECRNQAVTRRQIY